MYMDSCWFFPKRVFITWICWLEFLGSVNVLSGAKRQVGNKPRACMEMQKKVVVCVIQKKKGYLLLLSCIVSSVARPDLRFGGEEAQVAVCHFPCFKLRASWSVAAVINTPRATIKAVVLHRLGAQESCSSLCFGCNFCCFSGFSAGDIFPWSCCAGAPERSPKRDQAMT